MKKVLFLIVFLNLSYVSFSQEFQYFLKESDISLDGGEISDKALLKISEDENGFYQVIIASFDENDNQVSFKLKPFTYPLFKAKLINSFVAMKDKELVTGTYKESSENDIEISNLYSKAASYFFTVNERPKVATISLKNEEIDIYAHIDYKKDSKNKRYDTKIGILKDPVVEISFYSGFIEKIELRGQMNDVKVTFVNTFSIGVSSIKNITRFRDIRLNSLYAYNIDFNKDSTNDEPERSNNSEHRFTISPEDKSSKIDDGYSPVESSIEKMFVYLNDVINYQRIIDVNANDISPAKQKILLDKKQKSSDLYKEESTKLLEAVVYSDLIGALEEENPNGIIQTEISRRFNLNTSRKSIVNRGGGTGLVEYLEGKVLLSKIEENNKFLLPSELDNTFDNLSLYQYRNFSVGGILNLITFENQNWKLNAFLDTGVEFSRSGYRLTEEGERNNVNALEWQTQLKAHFFPEKRYGLYVSDKLSYYEILSDETELLNNLNAKSNWINTIEFMAYLDVSTSSKLFLRYSLVHDLSDINNNFSRLQIGNVFYILQKNRKDN